MRIYEQPVEDYKNKFVVTEDKAYFVLCVADTDIPSFNSILHEVFNLDDPEIYKRVDEGLGSGRIILGYYDLDGFLDIHVTLERSHHIEKRLEEIFGEDARS